jgi:hypothetical protein
LVFVTVIVPLTVLRPPADREGGFAVMPDGIGFIVALTVVVAAAVTLTGVPGWS